MKKNRHFLAVGFIVVILIAGVLVLPKAINSDILTGLVSYLNML